MKNNIMIEYDSSVCCHTLFEFIVKCHWDTSNFECLIGPEIHNLKNIDCKWCNKIYKYMIKNTELSHDSD